MAGSIRPTRQEVTRQFPVLGFTVRTGRRPGWFEVALATDPALFSRTEGRTASTFYSSRAEGDRPLPAPAGEAVYLVPQRALARFVGKGKLYYRLAVYGEPSFREPEVPAVPEAAVPYVHLSKSYTGEVRGSVRGGLEGTYGGGAPLAWGGDAARTDAPRPTGDGAPAPTPGGDGAAGSLAYDDGFGPDLWTPSASAMSSDIPLDPGPGPGGRSIGYDALAPGDLLLTTTHHPISWAIRNATDSMVSHAMLYAGGGKVIEAVQEGVREVTLMHALGLDRPGERHPAVLAVAYRHPGLSAEDAARAIAWAREKVRERASYNFNMLAALRHRVTGSGGTPDLEPGDDSSFFCSQLVLEAYRRAGSALTSTPPDWNSPQNIAQLALARRLHYVGHLVATATADELGVRALSGDGADDGTPVARVRDAMVDCAGLPAGDPKHTEMGTTDPVGTLQTAVEKAVDLLDRAIGELEYARGRIVDDGEPAAYPTFSDWVGLSLKTRMLIDPDVRANWTGTGPRTVYFVTRWLKNIRKILAGGHIKYTCLDPDCGSASQWGAAIPGEYRIYLCRRWWQGDAGQSDADKLRNRATTLIHEASHIYYSTVDDAGRGIWRADCLEQLVSDLADEHLPAAFEESCGPADLSTAQGLHSPRGRAMAAEGALDTLLARLRERGFTDDELAPAASEARAMAQGFAHRPPTGRALSGGTAQLPTLTTSGRMADLVRAAVEEAERLLPEVGQLMADLRRRIASLNLTVGVGVTGAASGGGGVTGAVGFVIDSTGAFGFYGTVGAILGATASGDLFGQVTVINGRLADFGGVSVSMTVDGGEGVGGGVGVLFHVPSGRFLGVSLQIGATAGSPIEAYLEVQATYVQQVGQLGHGRPARRPSRAFATGDGDLDALLGRLRERGFSDDELASVAPQARAVAQSLRHGPRRPRTSRAMQGGSGQLRLPQLTTSGRMASLLSAAVEEAEALFPDTWGTFLRDLRAQAARLNVTVGVGISGDVGIVEGVGAGGGFVIDSTGAFGFYGGLSVSVGALASGDVMVQVTIVGGTIHDYGGASLAYTLRGGEGLRGGGALLFTLPSHDFAGVSVHVGVGAGSPFEAYIEAQAEGVLPVGQLGHGGDGHASRAPGYAARAQAAGAHARAQQAGGIEIASAIAGATMSAVIQNKGDISLRLEQLHGKKFPADDRSNEGGGAYQNTSIDLRGWPTMASMLGADEIYATLRIDFDHNGRTVGNVRIVDTAVNDAAGGELDVTATVMDDARVYLNRQGETMAGVKVSVRYRFGFWNTDRTAVTDLVLYGDGRVKRTSAWTDTAAYAARRAAEQHAP